METNEKQLKNGEYPLSVFEFIKQHQSGLREHEKARLFSQIILAAQKALQFEKLSIVIDYDEANIPSISQNPFIDAICVDMQPYDEIRINFSQAGQEFKEMILKSKKEISK